MMLNAVEKLWPVLFLFIGKRFLEKVLGHLFEQWPKYLFKLKKKRGGRRKRSDILGTDVIYQLLMKTYKRYFKVIH